MFADVVTAVTAGKLPLPLGLSFVPRLLAGGDRFTVGDSLSYAGLGEWVPDELLGKYEAWLRLTYGPGAARVGMLPHDGDDLDAETMRAELVGAVAESGRDPAFAAEAVKLAASWRTLPQSVRGRVLDLATDASADVFARTLAEVRTETDPSNRRTMLWALAGVRDPARHTAALGLVLDDKVDIRESMYLPFAGRDRASHELARSWLLAHQAAVLARIPTTARPATRRRSRVCSRRPATRRAGTR